MDAKDKVVDVFVARVRQLMFQYQDLLKENKRLGEMLEERNECITKQKAEMAKLQNDYEALKNARMLAVTSGDAEQAKKRLNSLIRDVDKCITLLSGD